jgi:hypothetical protein
MCCNEVTDGDGKLSDQEFYCKNKRLINEGGFSSIFRRKEVEKFELHCASLDPENNLFELLDLM